MVSPNRKPTIDRVHLSNFNRVWLTSVKPSNRFDSHSSNSNQSSGFCFPLSYTLRTGSQPICACSGRRSNATLATGHSTGGAHTKGILAGVPRGRARGLGRFQVALTAAGGDPPGPRCRPPDLAAAPRAPPRPPRTPRRRPRRRRGITRVVFRSDPICIYNSCIKCRSLLGPLCTPHPTPRRRPPVAAGHPAVDPAAADAARVTPPMWKSDLAVAFERLSLGCQ